MLHLESGECGCAHDVASRKGECVGVHTMLHLESGVCGCAHDAASREWGVWVCTQCSPRHRSVIVCERDV